MLDKNAKEILENQFSLLAERSIDAEDEVLLNLTKAMLQIYPFIANPSEIISNDWDRCLADL